MRRIPRAITEHCCPCGARRSKSSRQCRKCSARVPLAPPQGMAQQQNTYAATAPERSDPAMTVSIPLSPSSESSCSSPTATWGCARGTRPSPSSSDSCSPRQPPRRKSGTCCPASSTGLTSHRNGGGAYDQPAPALPHRPRRNRRTQPDRAAHDRRILRRDAPTRRILAAPRHRPYRQPGACPPKSPA